MAQSPFESIKHLDSHGQEFWSARELSKVLKYSQWRNFETAIEKAKISCESAWNKASDHFADASKPIVGGKWAKQVVLDYHLSRYACYLVAQNGDPRKEAIALAQMYFASQTRKQELYQEYLGDKERLKEREKYSETDKELSGTLFDKWLKWPQIAGVKARGQKAFYNAEPDTIRKKYDIKGKKPIVDKAPQILITAQSLANQMTAMNVGKTKHLASDQAISREHITNNQSVRNTLIGRGIVPEALPPEEDTKKLPKKIQTFEEGLWTDLLE